MGCHSRDLIIATYESREAILYYWNTFIFLLIVKKVLLKGKKSFAENGEEKQVNSS